MLNAPREAVRIARVKVSEMPVLQGVSTALPHETTAGGLLIDFRAHNGVSIGVAAHMFSCPSSSTTRIGYHYFNVLQGSYNGTALYYALGDQQFTVRARR